MNDEHPTRPPNLTPAESEALLRGLGQGVDRRTALPEVFRALADHISDSRLQLVAQQITERLEAGADLPAALASVQQTIPVHLRQALTIGATSGNLAAVLKGLAESELNRREMRRGLWAVLAYPLLVVVLLGLLLAYVFIVLCPMFQEIFDDFDLDLPQITVMFMAVYKSLPWIVGGMILLGLALVSFAGIPSRFVHWIRTTLPLFGRAWQWSGHHEFASLLATLTAEHVPLVDALDCTIQSLRDRNLARAAGIARDKCAQGKTLSQSLCESIHFDRTLTSLVAWGETHDTLPAALSEAAATYVQQMSLYTQFLERIVPPILLIAVAVVLLFSTMAFFVPLIDLINGLTG